MVGHCLLFQFWNSDRVRQEVLEVSVKLHSAFCPHVHRQENLWYGKYSMNPSVPPHTRISEQEQGRLPLAGL